jgi:hypothetical protein
LWAIIAWRRYRRALSAQPTRLWSGFAFLNADHTTASAGAANETAATLEHDEFFPREPLLLEEEIEELLRSLKRRWSYCCCFVEADHTTVSTGEANETEDNTLEDGRLS